MTPQAADRNTGHGHVWERPDGLKVRCGGPSLCIDCALDYARYHNQPIDPEATIKMLERIEGMTTHPGHRRG